MRKEEWEELERGDIIRHKLKSRSWLVNDIHIIGGTRFLTIVDTNLISNPEEWDLIRKAQK